MAVQDGCGQEFRAHSGFVRRARAVNMEALHRHAASQGLRLVLCGISHCHFGICPLFANSSDMLCSPFTISLQQLMGRQWPETGPSESQRGGAAAMLDGHTFSAQLAR